MNEHRFSFKSASESRASRSAREQAEAILAWFTLLGYPRPRYIEPDARHMEIVMRRIEEAETPLFRSEGPMP